MHSSEGGKIPRGFLASHPNRQLLAEIKTKALVDVTNEVRKIGNGAATFSAERASKPGHSSLRVAKKEASHSQQQVSLMLLRPKKAKPGGAYKTPSCRVDILQLA